MFQIPLVEWVHSDSKIHDLPQEANYGGIRDSDTLINFFNDVLALRERLEEEERNKERRGTLGEIRLRDKRTLTTLTTFTIFDYF